MRTGFLDGSEIAGKSAPTCPVCLAGVQVYGGRATMFVVNATNLFYIYMYIYIYIYTFVLDLWSLPHPEEPSMPALCERAAPSAPDAGPTPAAAGAGAPGGLEEGGGIRRAQPLSKMGKSGSALSAAMTFPCNLWNSS